MEKHIAFSKNESDLLGLNVGRLIIDQLPTETIVEEIISERYDLVRWRTPAANEAAITNLNQLPFLNYFSGSIRKYKSAVSKLPPRDFIHNDIIYEAYDGSQDDLLLELLKGTWGNYPLGYYKTPYLGDLVTKEQELSCVFEFYRKHNLPTNNSNNGIRFMKHKGNYVGFFALNIIEEHLESHIGGIVNPYRESGYFYDMQEYIRRYCIEHKLKYFCFGARNENGRVQSIFQEFGYTPFATDNIFHIIPMLSYSNENTRQIKIEAQADVNDIQLIIERSNSAENSKQSYYGLGNMVNREVKLSTTTIKSEQSRALTINKAVDKNNQIIAMAYHQIMSL